MLELVTGAQCEADGSRWERAGARWTGRGGARRPVSGRPTRYRCIAILEIGSYKKQREMRRLDKRGCNQGFYFFISVKYVGVQ